MGIKKSSGIKKSGGIVKSPIPSQEIMPPAAPPIEPALASIMREPDGPTGEPLPQGGFGTAIKGAYDMGNEAIGLAVKGFKSTVTPAYDRAIERLGGEPEGFAGRREQMLDKDVVQSALKLQDIEVGQAFEGRNYWHDVAGTFGSGALPILSGVAGFAVGGEKGGRGAAAVMESAQEQGFVMKELILNHGFTPEDAYKKSLLVFAANLPLNYVLDKWMFKGTPDKKFVKQLQSAGGAKAIAGLLASRFGKAAIQEPLQEPIQDIISTGVAEGELPPLKDLGYSALVAAPLGIIGGGTATVPHATKAVFGEYDQFDVIPGGKPLDADGTEITPEKSESPEVLDQWAQEATDGAAAAREAGDEAAAADLEKQASEFREKAYNNKSFEQMTPEERSSMPIEGVKFTELTSKLLRREITVDEFFSSLSQYTGKQAGAVSEGGIKLAERKMKAERKTVQQQNKGLPKDQRIPVPPKPTKKSAWHRAMLETLAPELLAEIQGEESLASVMSNSFKDKRRTISDITRHRKRSIMMNTLQRLGQTMELVRGRLEDGFVAEMNPALGVSGTKKGSKKAGVLGRAINMLPANTEAISFFEGERGDKLFKGLSEDQRAKMEMSAQLVRELLEKHRGRRDSMSQAFLGKEFKGLESYFPKVEKLASRLRHPLDRLEQVSRPFRHNAPEDDTGSTKLRSPREMHRTDSDLKHREWDAWKVMEDYIGDTARKAAYQPVVSASAGVELGMLAEADKARKEAKAALAHARKLEKDNDGSVETASEIASLEKEAVKLKSRALGLETSAQAITAVMQSSYNNVSFGFLNKAIKRGKTSTTDAAGNRDKRARSMVLADRGAAKLKRTFNRAKYKLNLPFILYRQWTSSGQAWGFEGVTLKDIAGSALQAIGSIAADTVRYDTKATKLSAGTYTGTIKSGTQGRMSREGESGMRKARLGKRGFWEALDNMTDAPTSYVEQVTGRFSAAVGDKVADRISWIDENGNEVIGLNAQMKNEFISDLIAMMQSEYHHESRAEILRNPILNAAIPAQSFALEMGHNLSRADNVHRVKLLSGMLVANLAYQFANNYRDLRDTEDMSEFAGLMFMSVLQTAAPWSNIVTGGGPSHGTLYTVSLGKDMWDVKSYVTKAFEEGRTEKERDIYLGKAANELVKNFMPTGGQVGRVIMAKVMVDQEFITKEEQLQASLTGWWTTASGRKYLRQITGNVSESDKEEKKDGSKRRSSRSSGRTTKRRTN